MRVAACRVRFLKNLVTERIAFWSCFDNVLWCELIISLYSLCNFLEKVIRIGGYTIFKRTYHIPMLVTLINHQLIIIIPRFYEDCFEALRKYIYHIIIHFSSCLPSHYVHNVINYAAVVMVFNNIFIQYFLFLIGESKDTKKTTKNIFYTWYAAVAHIATLIHSKLVTWAFKENTCMLRPHIKWVRKT